VAVLVEPAGVVEADGESDLGTWSREHVAGANVDELVGCVRDDGERSWSRSQLDWSGPEQDLS
jgi:hypothetical protein